MPERARGEPVLSQRLLMAFAGLGLAFLASVLWILADEHSSEWRAWQTRFAQLQSSRPGEASRDPAPPAIRQIWLRDLDRVDRCTSCHLDVEAAGPGGAEQPFRAHSGDWLATHPPRQFGCTLCHGGRGEATTLEGARHSPDDGPGAISSSAALDADCGRCHRGQTPPRAPRLAEGRRLIAASNCVGCHEIPGLRAEDVRAPRLDGLAEKLQPGWLRGWLRDPRASLEASRMPDFRLEPDEVDDLAAFLLAPREDTSASPLPPAAWDRGDPERGGELFRTSRCVTCHAVDGRGGDVGPELSRVGSKIRRAWLYRFIEDPFRHQPDTLMPRFRFDAAQRADLVAYLSRELVADEPTTDARPGRGRVEAGRALFLERGCAGCHAVAGIEGAPRIGPSLADVASRATDDRLLLERGLRPSLGNRIYAQLRAPERLSEKALMPSFGFGEAEAAAVALAVLSLASEAPPSPWLAAEPEVLRTRAPQGRIGALMRRYRCLSCHRLGGRGHELSTVDLDRIGSQLQPRHLESFLLRPRAIRVGVAERMPRLGLSRAEARALADYMTTQLVDDSLEAPLTADANAERGRELYGRLGCEGCHIVAGRGGYLGPDLGDSRRRSRPGWIAAWLLDPDGWKPGTLQPDYGLNAESARDLAAYLMTLEAPPTELAP